MATPRETQVLRVMERLVRTKVRQVAEEIDTSELYARRLLDYLTRGRHVMKLGRDTYQITSKGIDAVIDEYLRTLTGLERVINKHLDDERRLVEEIQRLKLRKNELVESCEERVL
ncbi:hypothetical protein MYX84_09025 [Acidobacteria bacterium AH-259-O06]|nr:hypothetical protein [Acidobacteria bacterium AH-259-O06]